LPKSKTANSCGIHVHVGKTCSNATEVGGHFYGVEKDPWTGANNGVYITHIPYWKKVSGIYPITADVGKTLDDMVGHAFVLHGPAGERIGCGLLGKNQYQK